MKENKISQAAEPDGAPFRTQANPPHPLLALADQPDIRRLNAEVLIHSGYHVDAAADGATARKALSADSYDLMITDNNMSRLTGAELLKKLRSARMALPVVMAAELPMHELARNPSLQLAALLQKPFYVSQLLDTVRVVLHASVSPREQIAQLNWQNQPSAAGLRL